MVLARVWLLTLAIGAFAACGGEGGDPAAREVAVEVAEVAVDAGGHPVIVLRESDGDRALPIWIGIAEARSIAAQLEAVTPPRPNTHDLAKRLLDGLEARVQRVVVTELREGTYYGLVVLEGRHGAVEVDSRPSDAIALALRAGAPIFVRDGVFTEAAPDGEPGAGDAVDEGSGREVRWMPGDVHPRAYDVGDGLFPHADTAGTPAAGRQLDADRPRLASRSGPRAAAPRGRRTAPATAPLTGNLF